MMIDDEMFLVLICYVLEGLDPILAFLDVLMSLSLVKKRWKRFKRSDSISFIESPS